MDERQARAYIVEELGKQRGRNDILLTLCREMDIEWKQADQMIREIEAFDSQQIASRQSPLLIFLGLAVILGGLVPTTYGIWYFWTFTQLEATQQLIESQYMYITAGGMVTGLAMITGGVIGFRKIIGEILG
jgi:hypothetical protein